MKFKTDIWKLSFKKKKYLTTVGIRQALRARVNNRINLSKYGILQAIDE